MTKRLGQRSVLAMLGTAVLLCSLGFGTEMVLDTVTEWLPLTKDNYAWAARHKGAKERAQASVYDNQPPVTDKELQQFLDILPQFRAWAKSGHEEAHPVLRNGKADFLYSPQAARWVQTHRWDPVRFFCVMGRMAAALAIVEEGNDVHVRAKDMPVVSEEELALARRHLGSILKAGGDVPPLSR